MPKQPVIRVAVCADPPHEVPLQRRASEIAEALGIAKTKIGEPGCDLLLAVTPDRLELRVLNGESDLVGGSAVFADPTAIDTTSPAGRRLDAPLLKAVGIKKGKPYRPNVIDATAGLGEDAWLLASHGCRVVGVERQPVIAALLSYALARAAEVEPEIAERIAVHRADAINDLSALCARGSDKPEAIVIDPMFPLGRKAKERKPMRVLRMLAGDDDDAPRLLEAARTTAVRRICIKRPLKAQPIDADRQPAPDIVYKGKAVRYDVYLNH
ncbi:MAG: class I SAM-dependent methyltransferase [Phycisphaeraceae bacterium]